MNTDASVKACSFEDPHVIALVKTLGNFEFRTLA